jgi:hypothetical protein
VANETENPVAPPTLVPLADEPVTGTDALAQLQSALEIRPNDVDLIVSGDPPPPPGKSWEWDFTLRQAVKPAGAMGPQVTRGTRTMLTWVEKCLNTPRGAHPIHPADYGIERAALDMIGGPVGVVPPDFEARVREALTFHPNISDVSDFVYSFDRDDSWMHISCVLVLDDESPLPISDLRLRV